MIKLNVHEAKTHLSEHLERLCAGKEDVIVLCKRNVPIAEIRPLPRERAVARPVGLGRGKVKIPRSFFEPLPDDLLDAFDGAER
jgi:antitoxin (DNA-binding transcriptional repressor) of toxin-antitoxin stability system